MSRVNIRLGRFVNWRRTLMLVILCLVIDGHSTKVQTKFGPIRGFWSKSAKGRLTANYLGVPYAEPPIGDLRFRSSKPWTRKWNTTYDATVNGNMCLQPLPDGQIIGTEDCLNLNIFVPIFADKAERRLKLPVLVYVHGGKYIFGNNHRHMSPPVQLMDQNLVLVTINYRLNIMGFFSTETSTAPGNYGLKDIVMALRWVQENIEVFHGDPKSVTLWGHSAGAGAVHTLSFSKNTEGLFHKYIIQSGSIFAPWNMNPENWMRQISLEAAKLLDCLPEGIETSTARLPSYRECNTEDRYCSSKDSDLIKLEEEMMSCMRSLDGKTIADALKHFNIAKIHSCCLFGPVVEEESEDAVLTAHPMEIIKKREFRDLPCIVGLVRDEGLVTTLDIKGDLDKLKHNFEKDIIILVEMHNRAIDSDEVSSSVEEFYFDSNVPELRFENLTQVVGDSALVWPVYQMLRHQSPVMNSSIFFYFFTYEGTFSYTLNLDPLVHYGVTHGDDLDYLMPYLNEKNKGLQWNDADVTMSDIMTAMWGNFVATGVPSASNNISWPDYKHGHEYLIMGNGREPKLSVGNKFLPARMAFWIEVTNDTDEIDGQEESAQPKQTLPFKGVISDSIFMWPTYQMLKHQAPITNSSTFFYFFVYEGTFSYTYEYEPNVYYGVTHSDDMDYLMPFLHTQYKELQWNDADVTMSDIMTEMWGNFAATGVPTFSSNISWPDYKHGHEYLIIGNGKEPKFSVSNEFLPNRMAFWIELMNDTDEIDGQEESAQPEQTLPCKGVSGSSLSLPYNLLVFLLTLLITL